MHRLSLGSLVVFAFVGVAVACSSGTDEEPTDVGVAPGATPEAGAPNAACTGAGGCFSCEPRELEDFLNRCDDGSCVPFDDTARVPLYNGGNLPPVP